MSRLITPLAGSPKSVYTAHRGTAGAPVSLSARGGAGVQFVDNPNLAHETVTVLVGTNRADRATAMRLQKACELEQRRAACDPALVGQGREKYGWERLSDVQLPRGIAWGSSSASGGGRGGRIKPSISSESEAQELGQLRGERWREGDDREKQLVDLQASIERMTRWLLRLPVVLGIIGVSGIGVTIWTTLN